MAIDGRGYRPGKLVIATGASAAVPSIPGIGDVPYLTSTTALELDRLPRSIMVIGAGYIGCELAQMLARAGVAVTVLCRRRLLPEGEPEISEALTRYFREEGITVRSGISYKEIRRTDEGVALTIAGSDGDDTVVAEQVLVSTGRRPNTEGMGLQGISYKEIRRTDEGVALTIAGSDGDDTVVAEQVLVSTGRRPNTEGMGLQEAGVERLPAGGIKVDDRMRTTKAGVYAAGDVTGRDMFVYMAAYGARIAAENALNGDARRYDATAMPAVTFTDPQAASVGLTEAAARERGLQVKTSVLPLEHVPRALAARDTRGLIKLVADAETDRLLGAHVLAPEGADSIQTAALAIKTGMTVAQLAETVFPYLTTVEGLKLAAQTFEKDVAKLSCCAG